MEELEKEFVKINEHLKKYRICEITEIRIKEIKEELNNYIKTILEDVDIKSEEGLKKLKLAIKNRLNFFNEIRNYISKERILEIREIIVQEYLK